MDATYAEKKNLNIPNGNPSFAYHELCSRIFLFILRSPQCPQVPHFLEFLRGIRPIFLPENYSALPCRATRAHFEFYPKHCLLCDCGLY